MIAPMSKVFIAARSDERDRLLDALRDLGVLHLTPVDPAAEAPEQMREALAKILRARQIVASVEPAGDTPDVDAAEAADEILRIARRGEENDARLSALHREADRLRRWGDLRLDQLTALADAGVKVWFYSVPAKRLGEVEAECVHPVGDLPGKRVLAAVATRGAEPHVPEGAEPIEPPQRDRPTILAEAKKIDAALAADARRLAELAGFSDALAAEEARLVAENEFAAVLAGGMDDSGLFAVRGWAPAERADRLPENLSAGGVAAAVACSEPDEDDQPPTLVRYPRWASPIKGLFDILGTVAGYKEMDVGGAFMLALPIFAAMLIGDGGYGLVFLLGPLLAYRKVAPKLGADFTRLLIVMGAATLVWGALNASFFGVLLYKPIIPVDQSAVSRSLVMGISFYMGAIHLCLAQLWSGVTLWPSLKALSKVGWAIFVWGMLGVVNYFVLQGPHFLDFSTPWPFLLIAGGALAILFDSPSRNPLKMLALGMANFPLSMLSAFSDVISYVRLMAVGLASGVLASNFNKLGLSTGHWFTAAPVILCGHALNIGLCMIALFAHGVRLNMLEFSNNLGMQWAGYAYKPFARIDLQETQA